MMRKKYMMQYDREGEEEMLLCNHEVDLKSFHS